MARGHVAERDVYVCDHFELKQDGPSIGDNVGNAIYAKKWEWNRLQRSGAGYRGPRGLPDFRLVRPIL